MQFQFDSGYGRILVYEPFKGMIHYVNQEYGLIASMGPLQPGEEEPIPTLSDLFNVAQEGEEGLSDENEEDLMLQEELLDVEPGTL